MKITDLKDKIKNKSLNDNFIVLKYEDNSFIAFQYIEEISKFKHLKKVYVDTLDECSDIGNDFFGTPLKNKLYILNVDKFETEVENFDGYKDVIVVCKDIEEHTKEVLINKRLLVEIPKLLPWQILEYMKVKCDGMNEQELSWLQKLTNNDIYRISNETDKLSIFQTSLQSYIFSKINDDNGYCDLNTSTIYDLTNAIIDKNYNTVRDILENINYIDVEGVGLVTILHKSFKGIIEVQFAKNLNSLNAKELGMSDKQLGFYKKNMINRFSNSQLVNIFDFLSTIDYNLKSGNLQFSNDRLVDYIICKLIAYQRGN